MNAVMNVPAELTLVKENEAAVCHYTETPTPKALMLSKTGKKVWYYRFLSVIQMMKQIDETLVYLKSKADEKAKYLAEKRASRAAYDATVDFKVGDIVYNEWGYDQTNVDFFKVVEVTKKSVVLVELDSKTTEDGFMCGDTVPNLSNENGKPERHMVTDGNVNFKYGCGRKWDGKAKRCSWYA